MAQRDKFNVTTSWNNNGGRRSKTTTKTAVSSRGVNTHTTNRTKTTYYPTAGGIFDALRALVGVVSLIVIVIGFIAFNSGNVTFDFEGLVEELSSAEWDRINYANITQLLQTLQIGGDNVPDIFAWAIEPINVLLDIYKAIGYLFFSLLYVIQFLIKVLTYIV